MSDVQTNPEEPKAQMTTEQVKSALPKLKLPVGRLKQMGVDRLQFSVTIPAGHPVEALLDPMYWANEVKKLNLQIHHLVDVVAEDGAYDLTLRVVALGDTWAKMRILRQWLPSGDEGDPTPPEARLKLIHMGSGKWQIKNDVGQFVSGPFSSKPEAADALAKLNRQMKTR